VAVGFEPTVAVNHTRFRGLSHAVRARPGQHVPWGRDGPEASSERGVRVRTETKTETRTVGGIQPGPDGTPALQPCCLSIRGEFDLSAGVSSSPNLLAASPDAGRPVTHTVRTGCCQSSLSAQAWLCAAERSESDCYGVCTG
jgi:hypothetical protein